MSPESRVKCQVPIQARHAILVGARPRQLADGAAWGHSGKTNLSALLGMPEAGDLTSVGIYPILIEVSLRVVPSLEPLSIGTRR